MQKGESVWELRGCQSRYLPDLIWWANQAILDPEVAFLVVTYCTAIEWNPVKENLHTVKLCSSKGKMKVGASPPSCAGCNSNGSGCHDARSGTVLLRSGLARSRNRAASPRCHPLRAVTPCRSPGPSWSGVIRAEWWPLPAACQN